MGCLGSPLESFDPAISFGAGRADPTGCDKLQLWQRYGCYATGANSGKMGNLKGFAHAADPGIYREYVYREYFGDMLFSDFGVFLNFSTFFCIFRPLVALGKPICGASILT